MSYTRFRHLAIERAKPAPTAADIEAIEALLGASLPASFRAYLEVANGGYLDYSIDVDVGGGRMESLSFCALFSADLGKSNGETFVGEIRSCRECMKIPVGVLPFARDGGGSMVFLDLSPDGGGAVVAFIEGLPAWTGRRAASAFVKIASSFDDYVDKLQIDRDDVIDHLTHGVTDPSHVDAYEEWLDIGLPNWRSDRELAQAVAEARARVRA
jgi:cell wall assembly regulator SMI1